MRASSTFAAADSSLSVLTMWATGGFPVCKTCSVCRSTIVSGEVLVVDDRTENTLNLITEFRLNFALAMNDRQHLDCKACRCMSFVAAPAMKFSKNDVRWRLPMSRPNVRRVTKMRCDCYLFSLRLAAAAMLRPCQQCPHQKLAGAALAVVATVNCDYALDALLQDTCLAIGDKKPIS